MQESFIMYLYRCINLAVKLHLKYKLHWKITTRHTPELLLSQFFLNCLYSHVNFIESPMLTLVVMNFQNAMQGKDREDYENQTTGWWFWIFVMAESLDQLQWYLSLTWSCIYSLDWFFQHVFDHRYGFLRKGFKRSTIISIKYQQIMEMVP